MDFIQPPSCRPISSMLTSRLIYFLLSRALTSFIILPNRITILFRNRQTKIIELPVEIIGFLKNRNIEFIHVMRYYKNLFNLIIDPENLFLAWEIFKRGKKNKPDVLQFEKYLPCIEIWRIKLISLAIIETFGFATLNDDIFIGRQFGIEFCTTRFLGF